MKKFIELLSELNEQRYARTLKQLFELKIPCGFFCGFNVSQDEINNAIGLKRAGLDLQVICVLEDSQRTQFVSDGIPIVTFEEFVARKEKPKYMLHIAEDGHYMFAEFFLKIGLDTLFLKDNRQTERQYDEMYEHLDKLTAVYRLLGDEESRATYLASIKGRATGQQKYFRYAPEPQYWLEPFTPVKGDICIDGGAYRFGENAVDFTSRGAKVYAFEMDSDHYEHCLPVAKKYNFTLENMGLFSEEREAPYIPSGVGSRILEPNERYRGMQQGRFIDLDTYVNRKELPRVDHIKLDIEGAELDCLKGATKTIVRWKPKLAISAYHKPEHLWQLALYVKSLRPDYEFAFRHYRANVLDGLPDERQLSILHKLGLSRMVCNHSEMVLYCR